MAHHVIVGTGTIGNALAARLAAGGHDVTTVSRHACAPPAPGVTHVALDAADAAAFRRGDRRSGRHLQLREPLELPALGARRAADGRLRPRRGRGERGRPRHALQPLRLRADLPRAARGSPARGDVHEGPGARVDVGGGQVRARRRARPGDRGARGGLLRSRGHRDGRARRARRPPRPRRLGDRARGRPRRAALVDFVDDVVRALEIAGRDERAWGRAWHAPSAPPRSSREVVAALAAAAGLPVPPVRRVPWGMVWIAGVVATRLRGLHEIAYQFDAPFVMDSSAFTSTFDVAPTPFEDACAATIGWWRRRRGFPLPLARRRVDEVNARAARRPHGERRGILASRDGRLTANELTRKGRTP